MNPLEMFSLNGKTALVTGSTRGIGKEIAHGLIAAGAKVYLHGRSLEQVRRAADTLGAWPLAGDLSQAEGIDQLVQGLIQAEAKLDILVNNAGVEIMGTLERLSLHDLDTTYRVNLRAPLELIQRLLPLLKAAGSASVINLTSIHETVPYFGNTAYCASKAALAMATRVLALELAPYGIRVNNLAPGAVETDINREVIEEIGRDQFAEWIPLGRVAQTQEMIGPLLFLASEASSYVTGTSLFADGGYKEHLVRYRARG
ncbi:MAG: SDR family oxidoreductase [Meiothermus sp.]|nr:SDR family oxidoreductase [Meiothermus sp.]